MYKLTTLIRPVVLAVAVSSVAAACGSAYDDWSYYPDHYPWYYTDYGTYTVVRRPAYIIDRWTTRAWRYRPYHGYRVSRHNSPVIVHKATKGEQEYEVRLTQRGDSTHVEVRARNGDKADKEQAKVLLGQILRDYK